MADMPNDESELTNPSVPQAASADRIDPMTRREHESLLKRTERDLAKQKKVTVKVQEDTYVGVNGYGFYIQGKTKVAVPQQIADQLEEAGRI